MGCRLNTFEQRLHDERVLRQMADALAEAQANLDADALYGHRDFRDPPLFSGQYEKMQAVRYRYPELFEEYRLVMVGRGLLVEALPDQITFTLMAPDAD